MATIRPIGGGERDLYHIHFLDSGGAHPDQGLPGGGAHPDQGLPGGGGHPSHPIYHPGHPDHGLPSQPGRPVIGGGRPGDPGFGQRPEHPAIPDNELPSAPPPTLLPGYTLVMVRGPGGKWKYAAVKPGVAPPIVLPEPIPPGGAPDQGLPPQPPTAGHLPTQPAPTPTR
jgi:hypothetical protein